VTPGAQRLPGRWLAAHTAATLVVGLYIGYAALQRDFGALGLALCVGAVLLLTLVPRFPIVGLAVFLVAAHVLPRYGTEHMALLDLGLLNWLAALTLSGFVAWRLQPGLAAPALRDWHWSLPWMALFLGWAALSLAAALMRDPDTAFFARHHPAQLLQAAVLLVVAAHVLGERWSALALALLLCLLPLIRLWTQTGEIYLDGDVAALCALALPFAWLAALGRGPVAMRVVAVCAALALAWMVWKAQNRGAAVGVALLLLVLWVNARHRWAWAAGALAVGVVVALSAPSAYLERFSVLWKADATHATAALDRATIAQRQSLWRAALGAIADRPLLGAGPGREVQALSARWPQAGKLPAHNSFLSAGLETGVVGMLLFAGLFIGSVVHLQLLIRRQPHGWRRDHARMVQASLCAYLGIGLVLSRYNLQLAYLLVGWAAALHMSAGARLSPDRAVGRAHAPAAPQTA